MIVLILETNLYDFNMKKFFMKSGLPTGFMLATFATIIWSWNYIIARGLHDAIPPSSLAFYRWLVASVVLAPIALRKSIREYAVIKRNAKIKIVRNGKIIFEGKLGSLKRFKDDAKEVRQGFECGLTIENYNDIKQGDIIEVSTMKEV